LKDKKSEEVIEEIERTAPETIVILGAPGSGKDTQAKYLSDALGYQIVSTGDLMRILAGHDEDVRQKMASGELIPDTIVEDELISAFILLPDAQPVILDGYPRNLGQAQKLKEILAKNNRQLDRVILIDVTEQEAIKRISIRKICSKCGNISADKGDTCKDCGGRLSQREDDKPISVKKRFEIFEKSTEPMIEYYKKDGVLVVIDGQPAPEIVRDSIKKAL
jgi:adenylate kinase